MAPHPEDDPTSDEGRVLIEGGRGRSPRTPSSGVVGFDPSSPQSVAAAREALRHRTPSGKMPVLFHDEPSVFRRMWRFLFGYEEEEA